MDLKKPINLSSLLNLKSLFKESSLAHSKLSLTILIFSTVFGITFLYLSFDRHKNQNIFHWIKNHYEQTTLEKNTLENKYKKIAKDNASYFSDILASPKSKMELSNALTQLIASSNLKLVKMNLNSPDPSKGDMIEIETDGSYLNIMKFSEECKKIIATSELQSYKLIKAKEGTIIRLNLAIKFNPPPPSENLPKPQKNEPPQSSIDKKVNNYLNNFTSGSFIKTGFVPVKPNTPIINFELNEANTPENKIIKDPFVPSTPQKANVVNTPSGGGYFLSGILYSKEGRFCVLTLPTGESKVIAEGEKIGTLFKISIVSRDYIVISPNNKKIFLGDEISQ